MLPAPMILIEAGWLTATLEISSVGTRPTRSYSPRAMMLNSASPRGDAIAPIVAVEEEIVPGTGAWTLTVPPSGRVSRASVWPAVTVSPASVSTSETFNPCRSGRTALSSRGRMMPDTSTILSKQDLAAFSTDTAGPLGVSTSSAANAGGMARHNSEAPSRAGQPRKRTLRVGLRVVKWLIEIPRGNLNGTDTRWPLGPPSGNRPHIAPPCRPSHSGRGGIRDRLAPLRHSLIFAGRAGRQTHRG